MEELVSLEKIACRQEAENWEEAIRKAGDLLVKTGEIEQLYIENMIEAVKELGPYMVLTKGFALAHASPCEAVKKSSVSLINLKEPVEFGSQNDPVNVVMCLACTDKEAHISLLSKIARKLMTPGVIEKLGSCESEEELYHTINE